MFGRNRCGRDVEWWGLRVSLLQSDGTDVSCECARLAIWRTVLDVAGLDQFHRRQRIGKSVVEDLARLIAQLRMKRVRPDRAPALAGVECSPVSKGVDD